MPWTATVISLQRAGETYKAVVAFTDNGTTVTRPIYFNGESTVLRAKARALVPTLAPPGSPPSVGAAVDLSEDPDPTPTPPTAAEQFMTAYRRHLQVQKGVELGVIPPNAPIVANSKNAAVALWDSAFLSLL